MERKHKIRAKPAGYWQNPENFEKEMNEVIRENNGEFPTYRSLNEMGRSDLYNAIRRHYGGFNSVRKMMGFAIIKNPSGHYKNWENVEKDTRKVIEENGGEFPTGSKLIGMGRGNLLYGIKEYYGGMNAVRRKMGYEVLRSSLEKLKDWKYLKSELKRAIRQNNGTFPTYKKLQKSNCRLLDGITKYYGRLGIVKEKMGYGNTRKPKGYYEDFKNVKIELEKVIKKIRKFPAYRQLQEYGYSTLAGMIPRYHGGMNAVRKKMGYGLGRKPRGHYESWEVFEKDMTKAIEENNGEYPIHERLKYLGYGGLSNAANKYHGGIVAVREKIGYNEQVRIKLAKKLEEVVERMVG